MGTNEMKGKEMQVNSRGNHIHEFQSQSEASTIWSLPKLLGMMEGFTFQHLSLHRSPYINWQKISH